MSENKIQDPESALILRCDNVLVSSRGLTEAEGKRVILFVPFDEVDHIILKFGRAEHSPIISLGLGGVLSAIGIYGLIAIISKPAGLRYDLGMIAFGAIGGALIFDALKKRYFLEVHKRKGLCRLIFSRSAKLNEIQGFCDEVRTAYKFKISSEI